MAAIPASADQISADWLNEALSGTVLSNGNSIKDFTIKPVGEELGYLSFLYRIVPANLK